MLPLSLFGSRKTAGVIKWKGDTHFGVGFLSGKAANGDIYEVYFNPNMNPTPCAWANYGPKGDTGLGSQKERKGGFTGSHLSYAAQHTRRWQAVVKLHGVFLSCCG